MLHVFVLWGLEILKFIIVCSKKLLRPGHFGYKEKLTLLIKSWTKFVRKKLRSIIYVNLDISFRP